MTIIDAYAGPGGWSQGLRALDLTDIGIERDAAACATRTTADHATIRADVATFPLDHLAGRVTGLIMSPPCQAFSTAGTGAGRDVIPQLADAIDRGDWIRSHDDDRIRHVLEVGRWTETLRPAWIACEQVPPVLPLWRAYADRWRALFGWSCWAGILNAADFGVPQTRRRAFLIARTDGGVALPPAPTHCDGGALTLNGELLPWVSMADALGWGYDDRGSPTVTGGGGNTGGPEPFGHAARTALRSWTLDRGQTHGGIHEVDQPSPVLGTRGDLWTLDRRQNSRGGYQGEPGSRPVPIDEPASTLDSQVGGKWVFHRPATTLVGDGRAFGPHSGSAGQPQSTDTIRLTIRDALVLQGFPPDYPVQGTRTKQFEQIGNAVPPPLAAAVIRTLTAARPLKATA
jgi:DNA (cytosine-5)-methyltransferase 1